MPPPALAGAVQLTVAPLSTGTAVTAVGDPGEPSAVTAVDGAELGLVPAAFVAVTVKVYAMPLFKPVIPAAAYMDVTWRPPGDAVTVYEVVGEPLSPPGIQ